MSLSFVKYQKRYKEQEILCVGPVGRCTLKSVIFYIPFLSLAPKNLFKKTITLNIYL
jgi:hypothetical protein